MLDLKPVDGGGITPRGNGRRCHGVVGAVVGLRPFPWRGNIKY